MPEDDSFAMQSACQKCAAEGGGCCTGRGSGIFLTLHDALRIQKATGLPLDDIAFFGKVSAMHENEVKVSDDFFYKFFRDGNILQLRRIGGLCKFMEEGKGCVIFNHRPSICRLFPFSFTVKEDENGEKAIRILIPKAERIKDENCSILHDNFYRSNGACFKAMNTSREKLLALVELHIKELDQYGKYIDDIAAGMSLAEVVEKYKLDV